MRLKIFFFPLSLVVALIMAIWYIQPQLTTTLEAVKSLKVETERLKELDSKVKNMGVLKSAMGDSGNTEKVALIKKYLTETQSDERSVDGVNFLGSSAGVTLTGIKMARRTASINENMMSEVPAEGTAPQMTPVQVRYVEAEIAMVGQYSQIKDFLAKLSRDNQFVSFEKVSIEAPKAEQGKAANPNALVGKASVVFGFLPAVSAPAEYVHPVFDSGILDIAAADDLQSFLAQGTAVPALEATPSARPNPFVK